MTIFFSTKLNNKKPGNGSNHLHGLTLLYAFSLDR